MSNIKMPGRKSLTKSDMVRAIQGLINHSTMLSQRLDDMDRILGDYILFNKDMDKFEEYLDGKYKQPDDEPSGAGSTTSKK